VLSEIIKELDLSALPQELAAARSPARARESIRSQVTLLLLGLFALIVIATFVTMWVRFTHGNSIQDLKDVLAIVFAPVVALVSSALGFYFGSSKAN
jgi:hypothetical protein